ncbi:hypothetical protein RRG08_051668 [Elysia crispata]|uniref:Uncharacterized protein n=1 Tax=Elysia crispata TaxID=231223 RepID=A0AAE1A329_9GAST|nr:hypothetical protein RRG08_051668 [Elysia crispata]
MTLQAVSISFLHRCHSNSQQPSKPPRVVPLLPDLRHGTHTQPSQASVALPSPRSSHRLAKPVRLDQKTYAPPLKRLNEALIGQGAEAATGQATQLGLMNAEF